MPSVPLTSATVEQVNKLLDDLRLRKYRATRLEIPGTLVLDLLPMGDDPEGEPPQREGPSGQRATSSRRAVHRFLREDREDG